MKKKSISRFEKVQCYGRRLPWIYIHLSLITFLILALSWFFDCPFLKAAENKASLPSTLQIRNDNDSGLTAKKAAEYKKPVPSSLHARAAILMNGKDQRVLFDKDAYRELPMASTTKIMTCLYALEHGQLTDIVTFSRKAASAPKVRLGAPEGSRFLLSDLLYALMLESDNDVAVAIAEHIGGSVEAFCQDMTREARDYGCFHTSFKTPNGLDNDQHYTSCYDLALLTCRALENPQFRKIIAESSYSIKDLEHHVSYNLQNKNTFLSTYPGAIGVKTGFTGKAGYCFVGAVEKDDHYLISVVLGSSWPPHRSHKWDDTRALMDHGIKSYTERSISLEDAIPATLPVDSGLSDSCRISSKDQVSILLAEDEKVSMEADLPDRLTAPVLKNDTIGSLSLYIDQKLYRTWPVTARTTVRKIRYRDCLLWTVRDLCK